MKKFINLLSFEMNRFLKFLVPTLLISGAMQLYSTLSNIFSYNEELEILIARGESIEHHPRFTLHFVTGSSLFELSIILIFLVFVFYSFFTWYREWLGKNTFIYRLLTLPTNRSYIVLTKSLVFMIGGLLAFAFQFGMYFVHLNLAEWLVTSSFYDAYNIHNVIPFYSLIQPALFPNSLFEFVRNYSFAFAALLSLCTGILIERSFGLKGLFIGAAYFFGFFGVYGLLMAGLYSSSFSIELRPSQIQLLMVAYQLVVVGVGYAISTLLLKKTVKV